MSHKRQRSEDRVGWYMKKTVKEKVLTAKQLLFIDKYFELNFNGTEAYLATYLFVKKRETAKTAASRLLTNVNVAEEVERRKKEAADKHGDIVSKIRERLELLAFSNIGNYLKFGPKGVTLNNSEDLTPEQLACVNEVTEVVTKDGGSIRFKLSPQEKNLELLMRYHGLIVEKTEHTGKDGGAIEMKMTDFPPMPGSIAEWERQVSDADKQREDKD